MKKISLVTNKTILGNLCMNLHAFKLFNITLTNADCNIFINKNFRFFKIKLERTSKIKYLDLTV